MNNWKWENFKHRNTQNTDKYYADCQVVTAVNAYYFLTGEIIHTDTERYFELCELAKACYGSAICIEKVHDELGLEVFDHTKAYLDMQSEDQQIKYPIEMSVWHPRCGFHSTLVVDCEPRCRAIRVVNFRWVTTGVGWMWEEDLNFYISDANKGWVFRKFRLKK